MNDSLHTSPEPSEPTASSDKGRPDLEAQLLTWVHQHPVMALATAGAIGAVAGAIAVSAVSGSETRRPGNASDGPMPTDTAAHGALLHTILGGAAALAAASLKQWSAQASGAPDPVADLADTDQFAQTPEAPPERQSASEADRGG